MKLYKISIVTIVFSIAISTTVIANAQTTTPIGERIKAQVETRIEKNKEIRNTELEKRQEVKNTLMERKAEIEDRRIEIKDRRIEIKDIKKEKLDGMKLLRASTTDMFKRANEERREVTKNMKMEAFQIRKNALEEHLLVAVNNLTNIANRIEAHIVKVEASRRTLTDAKALLVTAREKIAIAKTDIEALKALETADTSTEINLTKPREIGDKAIKSIKDAKESLKKVIVSIAKNMGIGNTASTTDGSSGDENDNDNDN